MIYPNPASERIEDHCEFQGTKVLELYDISGRLTTSIDLENRKNSAINILDLKAGIYFAVLRSEQDILAVEKLFKTDYLFCVKLRYKNQNINSRIWLAKQYA